MGSDGIVSVLAGMMLEAKARAMDARAKGKDARLIEAIDRSVRRIRDPRLVAIHGFSLVAGATGEIRVRHREQDLPISSSYLTCLLEEAGVEPRPGQVILLDEVLVGALVEEALGAVSQEEAGIRDAKSRLIRASLEVDSKGMSEGTPSERHPREAA